APPLLRAAIDVLHFGFADQRRLRFHIGLVLGIGTVFEGVGAHGAARPFGNRCWCRSRSRLRLLRLLLFFGFGLLFSFFCVLALHASARDEHFVRAAGLVRILLLLLLALDLDDRIFLSSPQRSIDVA